MLNILLFCYLEPYCNGLINEFTIGGLDATELKRVFIKIGEDITDKEMEDQVKDYDVDHDNVVGMQNNT